LRVREVVLRTRGLRARLSIEIWKRQGSRTQRFRNDYCKLKPTKKRRRRALGEERKPGTPNDDSQEVLFTLMAERYERRSMLITSNLVFSEWDRIFKSPMTTAAAVDRLVHHSVILEFDVPSYRTDNKGVQGLLRAPIRSEC
jgi:hypothetical protein